MTETYTLRELELDFKLAYKFATRERNMRDRVLRDPAQRRQRVAEAQGAMDALERMKNALKSQLLATEPQQSSLLDALPARRGGY